ncbi:hypothetical protein [Sporanaerobacter sp. PP17-6a]|jgi:seryl-tRNA synthetase|uniref:hypothetical protein n=1 Tax=Sporanaerobacter sp. PP17-6a TaxID=1891289 RepID=UPI00089FB919|nr:hypothetical protein [Sporanaerobacter sp. PP17-6a]SCL92695.1 hypothetical protein PP176A_2352 [Sporanaerobacter sp. PP17-6a]
MEEEIKKIIEIDKNTFELKKKTEDIINENDKNLGKILLNLEKDSMEEGKAEGDCVYNKLLDEGNNKAKELEAKGKEIENNIKNIYKTYKEEILKGIFDSIVQNC